MHIVWMHVKMCTIEQLQQFLEDVAPGHRFTSGLFLSGFKSRVMQANDDLAAIAREVKQDPALAGTKF